MDTFLLSLLAALYFAAVVLSVFHALLNKRDSRAAMGWIMACIFVPYGGPIAYFFFGINRVRTRARGLKKAAGHSTAQPVPTDSAQPDIRGLEAVGFGITGRRLSSHNLVCVYHNGDEAYPAMLDAINNAKQRVFLASYILKVDDAGNSVIDALSEASGRGVDVRVLIDGFGELYSWKSPSKQLRKKGVRVARFLPPRIIPPSIYFNLRNHRKLLLIDNDLAFAGGMNISDENVQLDAEPREITDIQFSLSGPVIDDLATVFAEDWRFSTRETIEPLAHAPVAPDGACRCRVIPDGPDDQMDALALTIQSVISGAKNSVDIMTPYFLPSRELTSSLLSAALRGVRVRLVLPGKNNLFYVHWANRHYLSELLERGVEAYYQPAPFCHSKLLCVDDEYSLIGSANLDPRSLRLNFELGVEIFSAGLTENLKAHIQRVITESHLLTRAELENRGVVSKVRDAAIALFSPYL